MPPHRRLARPGRAGTVRRGCQSFSSSANPDGIDVKLRQLIILRTAQLLDCTYEWQANVIFSRNAGLTDDQIALVGVDEPVTGRDNRDS